MYVKTIPRAVNEDDCDARQSFRTKVFPVDPVRKTKPPLPRVIREKGQPVRHFKAKSTRQITPYLRTRHKKCNLYT